MDILQKLGLGGETAVIGIAVVFLLLVILIAIVMLTSKATIPIQKVSAWKADRKAAKAAAKAEHAKTAKAAAEKAPAQAAEAADTKEQKVAAPTAAAPEDDAELIAVLTAAVAACMGTSARKVKIASYQRTTRRSAWANAGRAEQIAGRL